MLRGRSQTSGVSLIAFLCSPGFPGRQKGPGTSEGRREFIIPQELLRACGWPLMRLDSERAPRKQRNCSDRSRAEEHVLSFISL